MHSINMRTKARELKKLGLAVITLVLASSYITNAQQARPTDVRLDATQAPIGILRAHFVFAAAPGPMEIAYPKWIPGEHAPTGPINQVVRLVFSANGQQLPWLRDNVEPFLFHLTVPAGVDHVEADLEFACEIGAGGFTPAICSSQNQLVLNWSLVSLFVPGAPIDRNPYAATLLLPKGWRYATALPVEKEEGGDEIQFKTTSLKTLVDSPLIAGEHFQTVSLGGDHPVDLNLIAETTEGLGITPAQKGYFTNLVAEATALFGGSRYEHYNMLLTLGDQTDHYTLEHFQSSDNRLSDHGLLDPRVLLTSASLVPHEYIHSWNGKFRPPAKLDNPSYFGPIDGSLLWVYEGLTDYYGNVLAARAGFWTPDQFRQSLAIDAAQMATHPGRTWRSLQDTTTGAQLLYNAPTAWSSSRRSTDFYPESGLLWLDADTIIREQSGGKKSLDDFCRAFFAPEGGQRPKPYTANDVIASMNAVQPYDWSAFFANRLNSTSARPPLEGIKRSGWKLVYSEEKSELIEDLQQTRKIDLLWPLWGKSDFTDLRYSIGLLLNDDGTVLDSSPGMAAFEAGIVPGMQILAANNHKYSIPVVEEAVKNTKSGASLEFIIANGTFTRTARLDYHDGAKYPRLERESTNPDMLSQILAPRAASTKP
jgi:predicted metalloprotease with PDZ domain